jgi:hypothetical protein
MGLFLTAKMKGPYTAYYGQKRKEFPWLEQWIEKNGDPADVKRENIRVALVCVIASIAAAYILSSILTKAFGLDPIGAGKTILELVVYIACCAASTLIALKRYKDPAKNAAECPKCGCPRAWEEKEATLLLYHEVINKGSSTVTTVTDRSARDMTEAMFGTGERSSSTTTVANIDTKYYYLKVKDGLCANCGHSYHNEEKIKQSSENEKALSPEDYYQAKLGGGSPDTIKPDAQPETLKLGDWVYAHSSNILSGGYYSGHISKINDNGSMGIEFTQYGEKTVPSDKVLHFTDAVKHLPAYIIEDNVPCDIIKWFDHKVSFEVREGFLGRNKSTVEGYGLEVKPKLRVANPETVFFDQIKFGDPA